MKKSIIIHTYAGYANMNKLRDHCHVTGKFRGAAHNKCNINLRLPRKLPIIFDDLQGYGGYIIFKE